MDKRVQRMQCVLFYGGHEWEQWQLWKTCKRCGFMSDLDAGEDLIWLGMMWVFVLILLATFICVLV